MTERTSTDLGPGPEFQRLSEFAPRRYRFEWGPWRLDTDRKHPGLVCDYYEVDLTRCTTSAGVLDWICQVGMKTWASDQVVAGLVHALDDILKPQANLCSSGRSSRQTVTRIRELTRQAADAGAPQESLDAS